MSVEGKMEGGWREVVEGNLKQSNLPHGPRILVTNLDTEKFCLERNVAHHLQLASALNAEGDIETLLLYATNFEYGKGHRIPAWSPNELRNKIVRRDVTRCRKQGTLNISLRIWVMTKISFRIQFSLSLCPFTSSCQTIQHTPFIIREYRYLDFLLSLFRWSFLEYFSSFDDRSHWDGWSNPDEDK